MHFSNSLSFNNTNLSIFCSKVRCFCCINYILFVKYFQLCKSLCLLRVAPLGRAWWRPTVAIPTYWRTVRRKAYPHPLYSGTRTDSRWTSVPANPWASVCQSTTPGKHQHSIVPLPLGHPSTLTVCWQHKVKTKSRLSPSPEDPSTLREDRSLTLCYGHLIFIILFKMFFKQWCLNFSLTINNTNVEHSGSYVCVAENSEGAVYKNWTLMISKWTFYPSDQLCSISSWSVSCFLHTKLTEL